MIQQFKSNNDFPLNLSDDNWEINTSTAVKKKKKISEQLQLPLKGNWKKQKNNLLWMSSFKDNSKWIVLPHKNIANHFKPLCQFSNL